MEKKWIIVKNIFSLKYFNAFCYKFKLKRGELVSYKDSEWGFKL